MFYININLKIITQIQNIEYIDLAENAIKVFIKLILLILKNKYEDLYIVKINKGFGKNFFWNRRSFNSK